VVPLQAPLELSTADHFAGFPHETFNCNIKG
jgi:hypothetical protein